MLALGLLRERGALESRRITGSYPAFLPRLFARSKVSDADSVLGTGTLVSAKASRRPATCSTRKEKPLLLSCSTRPSCWKDPRWYRRSPNLS